MLLHLLLLLFLFLLLLLLFLFLLFLLLLLFIFLLFLLLMSADMFSLKLSTKKAVPSMQPFPTNLHVQKLLVSSQSSPIEKTYHVTMCGCPADHVSSFKNGGLRSLLENSQ